MPSTCPKFSYLLFLLVALVAADCGGESRSARIPPAAEPKGSSPETRTPSATEPTPCPAATLSGDSVMRSWGEVLPLASGGWAFVLEGRDSELASVEPLGLLGTRSISCSDRTVWWVPGVECDLDQKGIDALVGRATVLERRCFPPLTREGLREHCADGTFGPKACAWIQEKLRVE